MNHSDILQQTTALVRGPFELEAAADPHSEAELLALLAERIEEMLERRPEYLMSLLYRLDVLEEKIRPVMHPAAPEPAAWGLARLVLERQRQRADTKRNVAIRPLEDMDGWEW
jgi:DNA helicase HerA-like ATPase